MKPPDSPAKAIEKLYTLTLMVEEVVVNDRIEELGALLSERQSTLDLLRETPISIEESRELDKSRKLESQVLEKLLQMQGASFSSIQGFSKTKTALASYRSNAKTT